MDKKNTMLLTVIAVATLLVAVVGATFAYFSVSATSTSATATVTTKAESVGSIALNSKNAPLYLNLSADQMSKANATKTYHATTSATGYAATTAPGATAVAEIVATAVADANVTYKCTFNYSVKTTGEEAALAVLADDSTLTLSASEGVTLNETSFNLGTASATGTGEVTIADGATATISAAAQFTNTNAEQNGLAGASIVTTVTFDTFACDTVANS